MERPAEKAGPVELAVLKSMGLRWAVLAAWWQDLRDRGAPLPGDLLRQLEAARVKIASGCFSSCEVGCDLGHVERALVSADASSAAVTVDFWLGLLAQCMTEQVDTTALLSIPAVEFHYADCRLRPCQCAD